MFILDGAGDVPRCKDYQASPLAAASTPGLDTLARRGHGGLLYPIAEGVEPETHSGMLNLLGYPVMPDAVPRGPIEALGCGLQVRQGDLVLRVNFGTADDSGLILDRRVCRTLTMDEARTLCMDIVEDAQKHSSGPAIDMQVVRAYRACAVFHSTEITFSDQISNTDPGYPIDGQRIAPNGPFEPVPCKALNDTEEARVSASIVNGFVTRAESLLKDHPLNHERLRRGELPANALLTRGPGCSLPAIERTINDRFNARFVLLADLPIERGVGILVGCECHDYDPDPSPRKTYEELLPKVLALAKPYTAIIVHVKGPDDFGHDGDFLGKVRSIEDIDRWLITPLVHSIREDSVVVVTSDHATPCCLRTHSSDRVPFIVAGNGTPPNRANRLTEVGCAHLSSPVRRGSELMAFSIAITRM